MESPREIVLGWSSRVMAAPERAAVVDALCRLVVSGSGGGEWLFKLRGPVEVLEESAARGASKVDCVVTIAAADLVRWAGGELNPQAAFQAGRLAIAGDGAAALRFGVFLDEVSHHGARSQR